MSARSATKKFTEKEFLIPNNNGKPYTLRGVSTVWGEGQINLLLKDRKAIFPYSTWSDILQ